MLHLFSKEERYVKAGEVSFKLEPRSRAISYYESI